MIPSTRPRASHLCAGLAAAAALLAAGPSAASPETIRRATGNILFAPFDFFLSPVTAANSVYNNLRDVDDSPGVKIFYAIPGVAWNTGLNIGVSAIRAISGVLEFVPGLFLIPFEADIDPIFPPAENQNAIVDVETPVVWVKFGIYYTS